MTSIARHYFPHSFLRIVSGGQTGAESAALDWAIEHGVDYGGFCPRGRPAAGGPLPEKYRLTETASGSPLISAERNVRGGEATLICTCKPGMNTDSRRIEGLSLKHRKPVLHVWRATPMAWTIRAVRAFVRDYRVTVLHVTGTRRSKEPAVLDFVREVLDGIVQRPADDAPPHPGLTSCQTIAKPNSSAALPAPQAHRPRLKPSV